MLTHAKAGRAGVSAPLRLALSFFCSLYISLMDDELSIALIACAIAAGVIWLADGKTSGPVDDLIAARRELAEALPLYARVKKDGPPLMACTLAGTIAVRFSWVGDSAKSREWLRRKDADCAKIPLDGRG